MIRGISYPQAPRLQGIYISDFAEAQDAKAIKQPLMSKAVNPGIYFSSVIDLFQVGCSLNCIAPMYSVTKLY